MNYCLAWALIKCQLLLSSYVSYPVMTQCWVGHELVSSSCPTQSERVIPLLLWPGLSLASWELLIAAGVLGGYTQKFSWVNPADGVPCQSRRREPNAGTKWEGLCLWKTGERTQLGGLHTIPWVKTQTDEDSAFCVWKVLLFCFLFVSQPDITEPPGGHWGRLHLTRHSMKLLKKVWIKEKA